MNNLVPASANRVERLVTVDYPFEFAGLNIHHEAMDGNFRTDQGTVTGNVGSFDDILAFAGEDTEEFVDVIRQGMAFNPNGAELFEQLHGGGLANQAISMADDDDLLATFYRASQRE